MDDATISMIISALVWVMLIILIASLGYIGYSSSKNSSKLAAERTKYVNFLRKERLARLRHRDFKAFCIEVNNMRADKRQKPIPVEILKKVQYNLMYSIDED
jgi:hypothetical protein